MRNFMSYTVGSQIVRGKVKIGIISLFLAQAHMDLEYLEELYGIHQFSCIIAHVSFESDLKLSN